MSAMNHVEERFLRLGLLLAGGGSRVRRLAADVPEGTPLFASLQDRGAPRALLDTATKLARAEAKTTIDRVTTAGWQWLIPGDGQYPGLLAATSDPPLGLFVRGRLDGRPCLLCAAAVRCQHQPIANVSLNPAGNGAMTPLSRYVEIPSLRSDYIGAAGSSTKNCGGLCLED